MAGPRSTQLRDGQKKCRAIKIEPIGVVRSLSDGKSILEINPLYENGLKGIKRGDRLQVLYWVHRLKHGDREILRVHRRGDPSRPIKGVFRVRSPMRPNPIGVSVVEVERVEGCRLSVSELDALDGSPIIDMKSAPGQPV